MLRAQAWMLAASDWRRGSSFRMTQAVKKHNTPIVGERMQKAMELKQSIINPQHGLVLNAEGKEVPPILHRPKPAPDTNRQL